MSSGKKSDTTKDSMNSDAKATQSMDSIQERFNKEQSQGFRGTEVDPTPNENYTVAGVVKGAATPETDVNSAKEVRDATGLGLSALEAAEREKTQRGEK